jgi:hypothetical protein
MTECCRWKIYKVWTRVNVLVYTLIQKRWRDKEATDSFAADPVTRQDKVSGLRARWVQECQSISLNIKTLARIMRGGNLKISHGYPMVAVGWNRMRAWYVHERTPQAAGLGRSFMKSFFFQPRVNAGSTTKHRGRCFTVGLRGDAVPSRFSGWHLLRILHGILWCYLNAKLR